MNGCSMGQMTDAEIELAKQAQELERQRQEQEYKTGVLASIFKTTGDTLSNIFTVTGSRPSTYNPSTNTVLIPSDERPKSIFDPSHPAFVPVIAGGGLLLLFALRRK